MSTGCHAHPLRPARYRCDGCERRLCDECVEEGHRLLLCSVCGERALPLEAAGPTNVRERHEAQRAAVNVVYGWGDILRYCFRGEGTWIFWITVAIVGIFWYFLLAGSLARLAQAFLPLAISALLLILLLWIVPPQLARIVRTTYRGSNEIPGWAVAHEFPERSREVVALLLSILVGVAPSALLLQLLGCGSGSDESLACTLGLLATLPAMVAIGCVGFAAFAEFDSRWLVLRLDLHLRFLARVGDAWVTVGAIVLGVVLAVLVTVLLGSLPIVFFAPYVLFTGAHAVGVVFRRHRAVVEDLYAEEVAL